LLRDCRPGLVIALSLFFRTTGLRLAQPAEATALPACHEHPITNERRYGAKVLMQSDPSAIQAHPMQAWRRLTRPHWGAILGAVASLGLFGVAIFILGKTLSSISLSDLRAAIVDTSGSQILAGVGFTCLSYLALTGYDAAALLQIGARCPYRLTALASFASYAFSFNLGFPVVTGAAVRLWVYSKVKITPLQVANITVVAGVTFWLGMVASLGFALVAAAGPLAEIDRLPAFVNFGLGALTLAGIVAYCVWASIEKRRFRVRGHELELPGPRATVVQMALGVVDVCAAAAALYMLLPPGCEIGYETFLAIYILACILGVVSHAPGGIGVFEATMLHALPSESQGSLLASLLLFRAIYYFAPFLLACIVLGVEEGPRRWAELRRAIMRGIESRPWPRLFG
jgi:uncharacterized membrane protein YbhN (UPF0104 family)